VLIRQVFKLISPFIAYQRTFSITVLNMPNCTSKVTVGSWNCKWKNLYQAYHFLLHFKIVRTRWQQIQTTINSDNVVKRL